MGIAILDKQSTILVKTSMEKDVMVPVFVSAQMIQSLKLPYLRPPPGCTFSFFFFASIALNLKEFSSAASAPSCTSGSPSTTCPWCLAAAATVPSPGWCSAGPSALSHLLHTSERCHDCFSCPPCPPSILLLLKPQKLQGLAM